jgi:hypothetical protein
VNRPEPNAGPDRDIAAGARLGQARESVAAGFGITWARAGLLVTAGPRDELWIQDAGHATLRPVTESAAFAPKPLGGVAGPVIGLSIWARIDDQRQRSFVTGYPGRPPGFEDHEDIRRSMHAGRRQRVACGGRPSVPWQLTFHRA